MVAEPGARDHKTGVWDMCGKVADSVPAEEQSLSSFTAEETDCWQGQTSKRIPG